jgi:hypothetical protein
MRILSVVFCTLLLTASVGSADRTSTRKVKKHKVTPPTVSMTCKADDDCALTMYADKDCCPSLCQGRPVAKKSAEALEKYGKTCKKDATECPVPACAPPRGIPVPACVDGKCAVKVMSRE